MLLCSHILAEVQELCDTVTMIRDGVGVEHGTLDELRHLGSISIAVTPSGDADYLVRELKDHIDTHDLTVDAGRVSFNIDGASLNNLLGMLASHEVSGLTIEPPSLEQLFLRRYDPSSTSPRREEVHQ